MEILYSIDVEKDIIPDLMYVESKVYATEFCGKYESILQRYKKNKDSVILVYDNKKIVGYLCMFPISDKLYLEINNSDKLVDDDICSEDVLPYTTRNKLYLISVAILPQYQDTDTVILLCNKFQEFISNKEMKNQKIESIMATAISEDGTRFLKRLGFKEVKHLINDYKLMRLDL